MGDAVVSIDGPVATVTLNRPDRRNALTLQACHATAESLRRAGAEARVIVLTGAGSAFCAGGDFEELERFTDMDAAKAADHLYSGFQGLIRCVREVEVPVIAAVNGHAMGAGMDLALACDLRVASAEAKLGQVWVRVGLVPGTGGAFWTTLLAGPGRAAEMILTGEPIDAATAQAWGLVNEVVGADRVVPRARQIAETIAANPPGAVAANKRALNEVILPAYEAALAHAREVQPARFASEEFRAALAAWKKKA